MASPVRIEPPDALVRIASGQSLLLDIGRFGPGAGVALLGGIGRLSCACASGEAMTIAFLQAGDHWHCQGDCQGHGAQAVCLEALTPLVLRPLAPSELLAGADPVQDWTLQLLRIRHLAKADQRLHALLALLVFRLGRRCGPWCELPFRLNHDRLGELIGTTRVTTTRLMTQFRLAQLLDVPRQGAWMRLAPALVDSAPLAIS